MGWRYNPVICPVCGKTGSLFQKYQKVSRKGRDGRRRLYPATGKGYGPYWTVTHHRAGDKFSHCHPSTKFYQKRSDFTFKNETVPIVPDRKSADPKQPKRGAAKEERRKIKEEK